MSLYPALAKYVESLNIEEISNDRKAVLQTLVDYLKKQRAAQQSIALNFICIHNSRRSHLAQVWAQVMANYYLESTIYCFSGGTEATAMYPQIADTLQTKGFAIAKLRDGDNPIYQIKYGPSIMPIIGFSKKYDDRFNPSSGFAAVMVCDAAAEACPYVGDAAIRMSITYEDPKVADHRADKQEHYEARSRQIATEMKWVFSEL